MKVLLLTCCFDETIKDCSSVCTWVSGHSNTCAQLMPKYSGYNKKILENFPNYNVLILNQSGNEQAQMHSRIAEEIPGNFVDDSAVVV